MGMPECCSLERTGSEPQHSGMLRSHVRVHSAALGGRADLQQEECALEVQEPNDTRDDDGCEGVQRQMLKHRRQEEQHETDQCRVDQASCTCREQAKVSPQILKKNCRYILVKLRRLP